MAIGLRRQGVAQLDIGLGALGLRPQAGHAVLGREVVPQFGEGDVAHRIGAGNLGDVEQALRRLEILVVARPPGPAHEQPGPFELVARFDHPALVARHRIPVAVEIFAQGSVDRMDEFFKAQVGQHRSDIVPLFIAARLDPGQAGLEHVHMRVGLERQGPWVRLFKAAHRMRIVADDGVADKDGLFLQRRVVRAHREGAGIGQQGEGVVVEVERALHHLAIGRKDGVEHAGFRIARRAVEPAQALVDGGVAIAGVAHALGQGIGEDLACGDARAPVDVVRRAVEIELFVKAALLGVAAGIPPQGQGRIEQPVAQIRLGFGQVALQVVGQGFGDRWALIGHVRCSGAGGADEGDGLSRSSDKIAVWFARRTARGKAEIGSNNR